MMRAVARTARARQLRALSTSAREQELLVEWMTARGSEVSRRPSLVKVEEDGAGVATVTLDRPDKFNAFSMEMFADLETAFDLVERKRESIKCVVLKGHPAAFTAGIDLNVLLGLKTLAEKERCPATMREKLATVVQRFQKITQRPYECHAPVIAAVDGLCLGLGIDLISGCDMRYSTKDAKFCVKEVDLGIVADLGTLQQLPALVGEQRTRELAFTGRTFGGDEAAKMGLTLEAYASAEELHEAVAGVAGTIAQKSAITVRGIKANLNFSREHSIEEGLDMVLRWNAAHMMSADLDSMVAAVVGQQKRKKQT